MTRVPHLYRLALGRGAFESHEASEAEQQPSAEQANAPRYVQQYDERGYPRNAETEESRDIQVAAMNEVLAAVGVCEKKNEEDRLARQRSFSPQEWELIRVAEDYHSEIVSTVAECIRHASTWWISSVRKRIQVGLISTGISFAEILRQEWHTSMSAGLAISLQPFILGSIAQFANDTAILMFQYYAHEAHYWLEGHIIRSNLSHSSTEFLLTCADYLCGGTTLLAPILFSPLAFHATLLQLNLTTSLPLTILFPWHPTSPFKWALPPTQPLNPTTLLTSPLPSYFLLHLSSNILSTISPLRISAATANSPSFSPSDISLPPRFLRPLIRFRNHVFETLGWDDESPSTRTKRVRISDLALLGSGTLAVAVDTFAYAVAAVPLESLFLRSLSTSFLGSRGVGGQGVFALGAGPFGRLVRMGSRVEGVAAGQYVSKLGLCFAVQTVLEAGLWLGMGVWTRYAGRRWFYWGVA